MRSLRWLMVVGVVLVAQGVLAAAAPACLIQSFSASGGSIGSDGTIPPGGTVSYSIHVVTSPESPDDSRYRIDVGGVVVASGMATPNASGGEWGIQSTFRMPSLGPGKRAVRPQLALLDSGGFQPAPIALQYNGDPPAPAPAPAEPVPSHEPVAPQPSQPPRKTHRPHSVTAPNRVGHDGTVRPRYEPIADAAPASAPVPATRTIPQAVPVAAPRAQARAVPVAVHRTPRARVAARTTKVMPPRIAPQAIRARADDLPATAPVKMLVASVRPADARRPSGLGLAVLLALLVGGGGLTIGLRRHRPPEPPAGPQSEIDPRDAEIEAELQEIVAEGRVESELARGEKRAAV